MASAGVFTFDVNPFMDSIKKMEGAMNKNTQTMAKMGKTITDSIGGAVKGALGMVAKLGVGIVAVKGALKAMPEVGQAFNVAKDIITKNLLWPLRKEILPLLQKMMQWVTDHRAMFAKWGQVIANVFRAVFTAAKTVWDVLKEIMKIIGDSFNKALGTSFRSLDEFLNVMSFKIAAIVIFLGQLMKGISAPIKDFMDWIISQAGEVIGYFVEFIDKIAATGAVMNTLGAAMGIVKAIIVEMVNIFGILSGHVADFMANMLTPTEKGHSLETVFKNLQKTVELVGSIVKPILDGLFSGFVRSTRGLMDILDPVIIGFNTLLKSIGGNGSGLYKAFDMLGGVLGGSLLFLLAGVGQALMVIVAAIDTMIVLLTGGNWSKLGERMATYIEQGKNIGNAGLEALRRGVTPDKESAERAAKYGSDPDTDDIQKSYMTYGESRRAALASRHAKEVLEKTETSSTRAVNIDVGGVTVVVPEGTSPEAASKMVQDAMTNSFADNVSRQTWMEGN